MNPRGLQLYHSRNLPSPPADAPPTATAPLFPLNQPRRRWRTCHRPPSKLIAGHPLSSSSRFVPGLGFSPFERRRQLPETATTPPPRQPLPPSNRHQRLSPATMSSRSQFLSMRKKEAIVRRPVAATTTSSEPTTALPTPSVLSLPATTGATKIAAGHNVTPSHSLPRARRGNSPPLLFSQQPRIGAFNAVPAQVTADQDNAVVSLHRPRAPSQTTILILSHAPCFSET
ncbi:hypothetical protein V8G54_036798 [Vigna mungo]|uniref:Uncharacterized protein n=1 Tax=Vigna mungo TaxID=3915 RepID=A0AAQ3MHF1_VIGMU